MKKTIKHVSKTSKTIVLITGVFLGIVGVWAYINDYCTKNIDGGWHLKFTVNSSSYKPYIGETHTQKVFFTQKNKEITGTGEKWEYNGKLLPFDLHRTLEYTGTICGSQFKARYKLYGKLRESEGNVCLRVTDDGKHLEGTFSGTAGDSKGTVTGEKID